MFYYYSSCDEEISEDEKEEEEVDVYSDNFEEVNPIQIFLKLYPNLLSFLFIDLKFLLPS